ncbi:hypothetical protein D3C73_1224630 [compost metagenome]
MLKTRHQLITGFIRHLDPVSIHFGIDPFLSNVLLDVLAALIAHGHIHDLIHRQRFLHHIDFHRHIDFLFLLLIALRHYDILVDLGIHRKALELFACFRRFFDQLFDCRNCRFCICRCVIGCVCCPLIRFVCCVGCCVSLSALQRFFLATCCNS